MTQQSLLQIVETQYAAVARSSLTNNDAGVRAIAQAFGYTAEDLASLPPQANMGLSCGNPVAMAALREGETVVDLGCGGGLDVLLAAKKVGPTGRAIGIDMTADMLARARSGAERVGATNVEFHQAPIDCLPLGDNSVDCLLSNCVINLVPDKPAVMREMLRVLKPGGRVAISDIALRQPLPEHVATSLQAYVGCIAGAILIEEYAVLLRAAGFQAVTVQETGTDLNAYAQGGADCCCTPSAEACCANSDETTASAGLHADLANVLESFDANGYAASVRIHAVKAGELS